MALKSVEELREYFRNGLKPEQQEFWDWLDSFWNKNETIPQSKVEGLQTALANINAPIEIDVDGTETYDIPADSLLDSISVKVVVEGTAKVGYEVGGGQYVDQVVSPGVRQNIRVGIETEGSFTIYFTGNFTAKLYFQ